MPISDKLNEIIQDIGRISGQTIDPAKRGLNIEDKINYISKLLDKIERNVYVTPEMYGAVGDGTTDDTDAIQAALDANDNIYFGPKTYLVSGVTVSASKHITFNNTILKAKTLYQDYVINITKRVEITGCLFIDGDYKAYVGIKLFEAYYSVFDFVHITKCLAWGIYMDSCGHMTFKFIYVSFCGKKIDMTVSRTDDTTLSIDSTLTDQQTALLASSYAVDMFIIDNSGFTHDNYAGKFAKLVASVSGTTLNLDTGYTANKITNTAYVSKSAFVCFGGGVYLSHNCYSQSNFGILDTRNSATGISFRAVYGQYIQCMYSQSDAIPVAVLNYNTGNVIDSITAESPSSGYVMLSYNYHECVVSRSTGQPTPYTSAQIYSIVGGAKNTDNPCEILPYLLRALPKFSTAAGTYTVKESSSDTTVFTTRNAVVLNLDDTFQSNLGRNNWAVKTIYFMPTSARTDDITISLNSALVSAGYSINGGTNGSITFARPSQYFKVYVYLPNNKKFYLFVEELTAVTPVT